MAEYIERTEIFAVWRSMSAPASLASLADAIHKTPGIDIVLCKDCTSYRPLNSQGEEEWGTCKKINVPSTHPNDFCSRGERRTDG